MPGEYRTDDLALAVLLSYNNFTYTMEKLSTTKALWVFDIAEDHDDKFDDILASYEQFEAEVEPRKFVAMWGAMRRELFSQVARPVKSRPAPAS